MLVVIMRSKIERHQHLMDFARSRRLKTGQGHVEGRGEASVLSPSCMHFVVIKMGRRKAVQAGLALEGAYLNRHVTDKKPRSSPTAN